MIWPFKQKYKNQWVIIKGDKFRRMFKVEKETMFKCLINAPSPMWVNKKSLELADIGEINLNLMANEYIRR